jgi:hypothetical protein
MFRITMIAFIMSFLMSCQSSRKYPDPIPVSLIGELRPLLETVPAIQVPTDKKFQYMPAPPFGPVRIIEPTGLIPNVPPTTRPVRPPDPFDAI